MIGKVTGIFLTGTCLLLQTIKHSNTACPQTRLARLVCPIDPACPQTRLTNTACPQTRLARLFCPRQTLPSSNTACPQTRLTNTACPQTRHSRLARLVCPSALCRFSKRTRGTNTSNTSRPSLRKAMRRGWPNPGRDAGKGFRV